MSPVVTASDNFCPTAVRLNSIKLFNAFHLFVLILLQFFYSIKLRQKAIVLFWSTHTALICVFSYVFSEKKEPLYINAGVFCPV